MTRTTIGEVATYGESGNKEEKIILRDSISELREHFSQEYELNKEVYLEQDYDRVMNTDDDWYCIRYLQHFRMDIQRTFEGMKHNLRWRKQLKINELTVKCFPKELLLFVPTFVCGKSVDGCPIIYIQGAEFAPAPQGPIKEMLRNYFYYLVRTLDETVLGDNGKVHVVLNQTNSSLLHNFELDALKWLVGVRDNWPSRVKSIRVVGLPFVFRPIIKMVISWLPSEWSDILLVGTLEELVLTIVDDDNLPWFLNGQLDVTCKLAPADNKWARDFDLFKDQETFNKFMRCFYISDQAKSYLIDLQMEHDKKANNSKPAAAFHGEPRNAAQLSEL